MTMTFQDFKTILQREFPQTSDVQIERFRAMEMLYKDWNSKINVISRKDIDSLYQHHVLHSLAIAMYLSRKGISFDGCDILDLGTGGGFPGIPLAVMFPAARFTLCDSIGKKVKVAAGVAESLGLENVSCVNARAEMLPQRFHHVVSRAVTTLDNFYPWVRDKFEGSIFYLKGGDVNVEISDLMRKFKLRRGSVSAWAIDSVLNDDYFAEKFVIQIEKSYLCPPNSEY